MAARTHQLLAIRPGNTGNASSDQHVAIGSGWLKQNGDITLKLDLIPINYQTIILRPISSS
jgi:hypothetical protein